MAINYLFVTAFLKYSAILKYTIPPQRASGVLAYKTGKAFIRVKFLGGHVYTYKSAVKRKVEAMKALAKE